MVFSITKTSVKPLSGNIILNLDSLQGQLCDITKHTVLCEKARELILTDKPAVAVVAEVQRVGLASILLVRFHGCQAEFKLESSPKLPDSKRHDINVRAVWGTMVSGGGVSSMFPG